MRIWIWASTGSLIWDYAKVTKSVNMTSDNPLSILMQSKRTILLALAVLLLVVPFGTGIAAADSQTPSQHQPAHQLSLSLSGGVMNAGSQDYTLVGGQVVGAMIDGVPMAPGATLEYYMNAQVSGLSTNGFFVLSLRGTNALDQSVRVLSYGQILSTPNAIGIPYGCTIGVDCTSEIPTFFLSGSQVFTWTAGQESTAQLPIAIESAYLNPFGGPLVISSTDGSISIQANYTQATIQWRNVQMGGTVSGTFGGNSATGAFAMNVNSYENLLTGTEYDRGTIGMSLTQGTFAGYFHGKSVVPTLGATDCSTEFGLPSGTCTMTGLNSTGSMNLFGSGFHIRGTYDTVWKIPAIRFTSIVSGSAYPVLHKEHGHQMGQNFDN